MGPRGGEGSSLKRARVSSVCCSPSLKWSEFDLAFSIGTYVHPSPMFRLLTRVLQGSPRGDTPAHGSIKKPRWSERISGQLDSVPKTPISTRQQLPSPVTNAEESAELYKEATATPSEGRQTLLPRSTDNGASQNSPPQETQAFSQQLDPNQPLSDEVEDEVKEGVWGYLLPYDSRHGGTCVVLRKRAACPKPGSASEAACGLKGACNEGSGQEKKSVPAGGFLLGRHPECGKWSLSLFKSWF